MDIDIRKYIVLAALAAIVITVHVTLRLRQGSANSASPLPGPKGEAQAPSRLQIEYETDSAGRFFIGSASELKKSRFFWFKFTEWSQEYGPIYQYKAFGKTHIVVATEKIANELLRERGEIYSSREQLPMGSQLMSNNKRALLLPYGGECYSSVAEFRA
jgi:hypothetical protein